MNDRDSTCPCGCLALFVLFPCPFFIANFAAGWPTIIAVHLEHTSTPVVAAATVLSICFAVVLVRAAASFLPPRSAAATEAGASSLRKGVQASPRRSRCCGTALIYCGGMPGGGYTPRRIQAHQLLANSSSSLAS
jgi:hypothetical protein